MLRGKGSGGEVGISFLPVVDGKFLRGNSKDIYKDNHINDAVSIIGTNADEGLMTMMAVFPDNTEEEPVVDSATFDRLAQPHIAQISSEPIITDTMKLMYYNYSCKEAPDCNHLMGITQLVGDHFFVCPIDKVTKAFVQAGRKVYRYHMTHAPTTSVFGTKWTRSNHGDDLAFVFGMPFILSKKYSFTEEEAKMSLQVIKYWTNLAKTG